MLPRTRWVASISAFFALVLWMNQRPSHGAESGCRPGDHADARERMVREQIEARGIKDPSVLRAMREVARHCFVPRASEAEAYEDHPVRIGSGQTISQPYIVALMTELLRLRPTDRVLEIGTGSGYQAAVLSEVASRVFTVEIEPVLAREARARLETLGYRNIESRCGDGNFGWSEYAPFDAIIVTAASSKIPPLLIKQLKPGGRMCIPVGDRHEVQKLMLVEKAPDGSVSTRPVAPVRFVPLQGGGPDR